MMDNIFLKINPLLKAFESFGLKKESMMLIGEKNIYKKAISQRRIIDLKEWFGGDYSKLSFDDLFGGKLRVSIPFDPPQRKMLTGLFEKLIDAGWQLPTQDGMGEAFKINKVEQKITLPGGAENTIIKDVADLKLFKLEQTVIPSGPRAGETTTRKIESSISKIISNPANNVPKEYSDWWETIQQRYSSDYNWKEIESLFKNKDELNQPNYVIIISRDPVDVLRMSDHKKIDSCHSEGRNYFHCAIAESKGNAPIAYIVNKHDLEKFLKEKKVLNEQSYLDLNKIDISLLDKEEIFADTERGVPGINPEGRIKFRKYEDIETGIQFAAPELKAYGMDLVGFSEVLRKWAWDKQKDIFEDNSFDGGIYLPDKSNLTSFGGSYRNNPDSVLLNIFFEESGNQKIKENPYSGNVNHNTDDLSDDEQEAERLSIILDERCRQLNNLYNNIGATFSASVSYDKLMFFGASVDIRYEIFLSGIDTASDARYATPAILYVIQESRDIFNINISDYYVNKNSTKIKEVNGEFFLLLDCEFFPIAQEDSEDIFLFLEEMVNNVVKMRSSILEKITSILESQGLIKKNNPEEIYESMPNLNLDHSE